MVGKENYALSQVLANDLRFKLTLFRWLFSSYRLTSVLSGGWKSCLLESMFAVQSKARTNLHPSRSLG